MDPLPGLSLGAVWARIAAWSAVHGGGPPHAPSGWAASLRPGASAAELEATAAALGTQLPPELRELLALVDGQAYDESLVEWPCAPWERLLPAAEVASVWRGLPALALLMAEEWGLEPSVVPAGYRVPAAHAVGAPDAPVLATNTRWVPFAISTSGGGGPPVVWALDCDPPPGVPAGRVLGWGGEGDGLAVWAPSLRALLADVALALEARVGVGGAAVGGGGLGMGAAAGGGAGDLRLCKVLVDDGPRIWHLCAGGGA